MDTKSKAQTRQWHTPLRIMVLVCALMMALGVVTGISLAAAPAGTPAKEGAARQATNPQTGPLDSGAKNGSNNPLDTDTPTPVCTPGGPYIYSTSTGATIDPAKKRQRKRIRPETSRGMAGYSTDLAKKRSKQSS